MIKLVQGFDIRQPLPIDGRILLSNDEMKNVDTNLMPDKYFAINKDDGRLYLFDKNNSTATITGGFRPADDAVKAYADGKVAEVEGHLDDYVKDEDLAAELAPYAKLVEAANKIDFRMDPGFILKLILKNSEGEELDAAEIDLPLEQLVVDAEYDEDRNVIILYVQSETSEIRDIEIPLGNLVSSLVSKTEFLDHAENLDLHVSDEERLKWDNAAEKASEAVKPEDMHTHINAGENVHIDVDSNGDITINADDTVYEAGEGINIIDGVINSTQAAPRWTDIVDDSQTGPMDNEALANLFNAKQDKIGDGTTIPVSAITGLSGVATSGDYDDLTGVPTKLSEFTNDAGYVTVTDIPEIPDASTTAKGIVQLSDAVDSSSSTLAATSKAVKSAIDEAFNAKGLANHAQGSADAADNKASSALGRADQAYSLANDAYGLASSSVKTESDPTVPAWAKRSSKPSYTAAEVGAVPDTRTINNKELSSDVTLTADDVAAVPKTRTVNSKALSSNITLGASDVGAVPTDRTINDKELSSDITLTAADVGAVPTTRTVNTKPLSSNITLAASDVGAVPTSRKINTKALTQDISLTASDVGAMSTSHAANAITTQKIASWDAKSDFSGSYNDLTNKPTIPTVPTKVSAFTNDAGYLKSYTETDPTVPA